MMTPSPTRACFEAILCKPAIRWVADETWHPEEQSHWLDDGRYELSILYSNDKELIMDILKYGADVEVIAPEELKQAVKNHLDKARNQYE